MDVPNTVTYELRDRVAWVGLNRPQKRNAINDSLLREFEAAARRAQSEARAMVVFGHGPCFCAGLDLAEHRAREPAEVFHHSRAWHAVFGLVHRGHIPAISALHGATVGGGASVHVARLLGASRMMDMMLTGCVLEAAAAERAGLVQYLVPEGGARDKAAELAAKIADMAPLTVLGVLHALPRIQDMSEEDGLFVESMMAALAQTGPEAAARLADFVAKRAAKVAGPGEG